MAAAKKLVLDVHVKALVPLYLDDLGHKRPAREGEQDDIFLLDKDRAEYFASKKQVVIGKPVQA